MKKINLSQKLIEAGSIFHDQENSDSDHKTKKQHFKPVHLKLFPAEFIADYFPRYNLNSEDMVLVAAVWYQFIIERNSNFDAIELLTTVYGINYPLVTGLERIKKLIRIGVLYASRKIVLNSHSFVPESREEQVDVTMHSLLDNDIAIHRSFANFILEGEVDLCKNFKKPYTTNKEFLSDWFDYVDILHEFSSWSFSRRRLGEEMIEGAANEYLKAQEWRSQIQSRSAVTSEVFPLQDIVNEYGLDENEATILIYLVKLELDDASVNDLEDVIKIISTDQHEFYRNRNYLTSDSKLIARGLVETSENSFFRTRGSEIRVSPDITRRIIMRTPINDEERLKQVLKGNDIFTLLTPTHTIDDLILKPEIKKTIVNGLRRYEKRVDKTLRDWGLFEGELIVTNSYKKKIEPGLLMLFHGFPGTGKTFAAGAIASSLGKKLLVTDISRLQSKWVGDSEKNVRRLFTTFEKVVRRTENPPVLLLNEADQFLSRRLDTTGSAVDVMYNSLQNLFLEAFEQLKGIMIATTNMQSNLDEAFSRRFHLKLEFPMPAARERQQLWKLHLPGTIPGADDIDTTTLAAGYRLSGGQIQIIVKNAATEAAIRPNKMKRLLQKDLVKYCELEMLSQFDRGIKDIGFQA